MRTHVSLHLLMFLVIVAGARSASAAFNYTSAGSMYEQNFDSLASSGTENEWPSDAGPNLLQGWQLYRITAWDNPTPVLMNRYDASNGSSASKGRFYSFGQDDDRALGSVGHPIFGYTGDQAVGIPVSATAGWIAASFTNGTGAMLELFTARFNGEQWSDAGDNEPPAANTMYFQYGFGDTFATVGSWLSPGGNFDFVSPKFSTTDRALNGNSTNSIDGGLVENLGGTISGLTWSNGETLWLRWAERNDPVFDHAMAIDDFSFTAGGVAVSAVPEANSAAIYAIICGVIAAAYSGRTLLGYHSTRPTRDAGRAR